MTTIRKKLVTDESMRPVAVLIEYADWLQIEEALGLRRNGPPPTDLSQHAGKLDWPVDGLAYQNQVRSDTNAVMNLQKNLSEVCRPA